MSVDGLRSKPTISLIVISILITMLVGITTIVLISGYVVTCGEMQYETRRQIYRSQTLGTTLHNPIVTCFSIMRDADMHTRCADTNITSSFKLIISHHIIFLHGQVPV